MKGGWKENRARLLSEVPREKTRGKGYKLKHVWYSLIIRKHFFTIQVIEDWNRFARQEVVEY